MFHRPTSLPSRFRLRTISSAALMAAALAPALACGAVEWHPDLDTARAASRISHRPVLAVFVAEWGGSSADFERSCLGSPEAEAVLATCFEPVRIDIDDHAELTRTAGVTHVPTACVLAADDTAVATFEMPDSPAAFVTAAILAAQRAAAAEHGVTVADVSAGDGPESIGLAPEPTMVPPAAAFGPPAESDASAHRSARGSMARVTAKVRELSAFAVGQGRPATVAAPVTIAQASRDVAVPSAGSSYAQRPWPAEPSVPLNAAAPEPAIEPSAAALTPTTVSPWLDAPATRQAAQSAAPAPPPAAAPLPAPGQPAVQPEPRPSGLIATLQKPFGLLGKPAVAEPPTLPPVKPGSPLSPPPAAVAGDPPSAPDTYGSMPVGLEGYCPVTLVDRGAWAEGRAQWGARHRGRTYLFAGPDEQRTFLADPDRYAPAMSGDDPVLALDRGSSTPGQRRYGVTYQSRMYLFATPETQMAFSAEPGRYAARILMAERGATPTTGSRTY